MLKITIAFLSIVFGGAIARAGVDGSKRPQALRLEELARLSRAVL